MRRTVPSSWTSGPVGRSSAHRALPGGAVGATSARTKATTWKKATSATSTTSSQRRKHERREPGPGAGRAGDARRAVNREGAEPNGAGAQPNGRGATGQETGKPRVLALCATAPDAV